MSTYKIGRFVVEPDRWPCQGGGRWAWRNWWLGRTAKKEP